MLIVHPSSTCDICLDGYNWTTPTNAPHAIACGHVFCLRCLRMLRPSTCPLCRKAFQQDRIKKLHVDRLASGDGQDNRFVSEEFELIQHVALFFGENTPDEDVNVVLSEVDGWLAHQGNKPGTYRALRCAVDALVRYKSLQRQSRVDKETINDLVEDYDRKLRMKEHDIKTSHAIEEKLLEEIQMVEDKYRTKLERLEAELSSVRNGHPIASQSQDHPIALSGTFMAQDTSSSTRITPAMSRTQSMDNPFPAPPEMSRSHSSSNPHPTPPNMTRGQFPAQPIPSSMQRTHSSSNPLPEPPRSVTPERLASLRGTTQSSTNNYTFSRSVSLSGSSSVGASTGRSFVDPLTSSAASSPQEDPHEPRQDRSLRIPVLVPGARLTDKVIPSRPVERDNHGITPGRTWNPLNEPSRPLQEASVADGSAPFRRERDEQGRPVYYQYGWVPGTGYAWFQVPLTSPWQVPGTSAHASGAGSSRDTETPSTTSGINARGRSIYEQPIVEDSARPEAGSGSGANPERTSSRRSTQRQAPLSSMDSEHSRPAVRRSHSSSISSVSLNSMALLNVPTPQTGAVTSSADRQDIMNLLGVQSPQPQANPSQPSPASTWGTVHSSQIPSRTSANPSVSDLGLVGLPEPAGIIGSSDEDLSSDSSVGDSPIDHDEFMTPRNRPLSHGRVVASPEYSQPGYATQGMGLLLGQMSSRPPRQTISGPQDLQMVSESLMRIVNQDGSASPAYHGSGVQSTSTQNPEDAPDTIWGARSGVPLYSSRPQSSRPDAGYDAAREASSSRYHSGGMHRSDREYTSDSEHMHSTDRHGHHRSHPRAVNNRSQRQSSSSMAPVIPPPPAASSRSYEPRPPTSSHVSERENHAVHFESPIYSSQPRVRRSHTSAPTSAVEPNSLFTSLGGQNRSGLLLSFTPVAGGSSSAVSATGQDSMIRAPAPRPISSRQSSLLGGLLNARSER